MTTSVRRELCYDGKGINGPDQYRTRIATFTSDEYAQQYGKLFEAAPEMLVALEETTAFIKSLLDLPLDALEDLVTNYGEYVESVGKDAIAKAQGSSS